MDSTKLYQALVEGNEEEALKQLDDPEPDIDFNTQNEHGQTFLHVAATKLRSIQVVKALLAKVDFSVRDEEGDTAVDLMYDDEDFPDEVEEVVQEVVKKRILESKKEDLEKLLKRGWIDLWLKEEDEVEEDKTDVKEFTAELPNIVAKVVKLHKAIDDADWEIVREALEDNRLINAADRTGLPPLHKAVILGETTIVEQMVKTFPETMKTTDNMLRTALHHAAGKRDAGNLYELLVDAGAEDDAQDLNLKTPKDIYEDPDVLPGERTARRLANKLARPVRTCKKHKQTTEQAEETSQAEEGTETEEPAKAETPKPPKQPVEDPNKPVQMYISPDVRRNPPPTTVDGRYVAEHLGQALTMALSDIAECRPWDPIEYLANWLYKFQENQDYNKHQSELLAQIREEEEAKRKEREVREKRRQELQRLQENERRKAEAAEEERKRREQEEIQRKAKEAALSQQPGLETVMEDKEEDDTPKEKPHKDGYGQTELHKLASQHAADLTTLLNMGYSPAERDTNNKTARDLAEETGIRENVEAIDKYVHKLVEMEEFDKIQDLLLAGYDKFDVVLDKLKEQTTSLPDETQTFLKELPDFRDKISTVFKAIHNEGLTDLQHVLETKKLSMAKDVYGRSVLHLAVLVGHKEAAEHLATNFPVTMKCKDNMERTPLHYAMAVSEEMTDILEKHGADTLAQDVKQQNPAYYKENPDDVLTMKASLSTTYTGSQADTSQQQHGITEQTSQQEEQTSQQQEEATSQQQEVTEQQQQ